MHWCIFDRECRSYGCPGDVYLHPLGIIVRFYDDFIPPGWKRVDEVITGEDDK